MSSSASLELRLSSRSHLSLIFYRIQLTLFSPLLSLYYSFARFDDTASKLKLFDSFRVLASSLTIFAFLSLGQFNKYSIRFSYTCFVYPCLLLAYLGQGARLVKDPERVIQNVFFQSIPGGSNTAYFWVTWIAAILASIIASQAMMTAAFSLIQQLTTLGSIPALKIVHTDDANSHRIFVPVVNFLILVGTIGLVVGFGTDVGLTNA